MEPAAPPRKRRRLRTVVARTLLLLALLPQLGILWVLHRPSPTTLPSGLVEAVLELAIGQVRVDCDRVTLDRSGLIRLQGVRVTHLTTRTLGNPGLPASGSCIAELDILVAPAWRNWTLLQADGTLIRAQGRLTTEIGTTAHPLLDRLDLRAEVGAWANLVASAGEFDLRAQLDAAAMSQDPTAVTLAAHERRLAQVIQALSLLRAFEGGGQVTAAGGSTRLEVSGKLREGAILREVSLFGWQLPAGAGNFILDGTLDGEGISATLRAHGLQFGGLTLGTVSAQLRPDGGCLITSGGLSFAGLDNGGAVMRGQLRNHGVAGGWNLRGEISGEMGQSRLAASAKLGPGELELSDIELNAVAQDLVRLPGLGEGLRKAEVDFAGRLELMDGRLLAAHGEFQGASGRFALTRAGWKGLRVSAIRPERPDAAVTGSWSLEAGLTAFTLTDLNIAGIRGEISGGLAPDQLFLMRFRTSPGNPFHPRCINALLDPWWLDLWARFDLASTGTAPEADVLLRGRWDGVQPDLVQVAATLRDFGFMGARFSSTKVRVEVTPKETLTWIDHLDGVLDGKPAGSARARLRWDWKNPATEGLPEIVAEGDLAPACALRLYNIHQAQRISGWSFGMPWTKLRVSPHKATELELVTSGPSRIEGVELGTLHLRLSLPEVAGKPLQANLGAAFAGGRLELDLEGNLEDQNKVRRLALVDVWWADLQKAVPSLLPSSSPSATSAPASLNLDFAGDINFRTPHLASGGGTFTFRDPSLKTVHLLGGFSQALGAVGIDFSNYPLTEAKGDYSLAKGKVLLRPLRLQGDDSLMVLTGEVELEGGQVALEGEFKLRKSPWGILGYINPNRLIAKMLRIKVGGTLSKPEVAVQAR
jgi:hypothetical protein